LQRLHILGLHAIAAILPEEFARAICDVVSTALNRSA
jgi:hypothetical protein